MNIGIIGLGLIGGSLGRTLVKQANHTVYGYDISEEAMALGVLCKAYDKPLTKDVVKDLDILFIALYPKATVKVLEEYAPLMKNGSVLSDCCGNKRAIRDKMQSLSKDYPKINFISTHPMAGREFSGIKHSTVNLFQGASMILVPVSSDIRATAKLKAFSLELGFGSVVLTTAEEHDRIIAYTSQLAHVVSSAYIKSPTAQSFMGFSAGSFRDMTRVARLSPEMWGQLMSENGDNLAREIKCVINNLNEYLSAIENKDVDLLKKLLADGNEKKLIAEKMKNKKTPE